MSRLKAIVSEFGGVLFDGGRRALIPGPGHSRADRSVSLTECEDGRILVYCFSPKDDWRVVRDTLRANRWDNSAIYDAGSAPLVDPASLVAEKRLRAERIWNETRPIAWSAAEIYLRGRAINTHAIQSSTLRFHPRMTSIEDRLRRPALLAALVGGKGALQGVQATLLVSDGSGKARVATPRRIIGKLMGGAVRLGQPQDALLIAEGVETALSASAHFDLPAWAALTAGNLARFEPPAQVRRLVIASDRDDAGRFAASRLMERLHGRCTVEVCPPPSGFKDWNAYARRPHS